MVDEDRKKAIKCTAKLLLLHYYDKLSSILFLFCYISYGLVHVRNMDLGES